METWTACPKCSGMLNYETPDFELDRCWLNVSCEICGFEYVEEYLFNRHTNTLDETLDKKGNPIKNIIFEEIK